MDVFIKMAVLQTVVDTVELLAHLHEECKSEDDKRKIMEMIQRLSTMLGSLQ